MARYHVDNRFTLTQQNLTTTFKSLVVTNTTSGALCRGRAVALSVGTDGSPNASDCAVIYGVSRYTASSGAGNAAVPEPLDPGDAATRILSRINFSSEPTYSGTQLLWTRALNQRASMQWNAPDLDAAIRWAATAAVGITLIALSPTYASTAAGGIEYEE